MVDNSHFYCEPISLQELIVAPNISREMPRYDIELDYEGQSFKPFYLQSLIKGTGRNDSPETKFEKNRGEWLILDEPRLAVFRHGYPVETLTPVALMTVTENGDNAYSVYLPLGECCKGIPFKNEWSIGYRDGYYLWEWNILWEERPFRKIMSLLKCGKKITYTYYSYKKDASPIKDEREHRGGGFRIL